MRTETGLLKKYGKLGRILGIILFFSEIVLLSFPLYKSITIFINAKLKYAQQFIWPLDWFIGIFVYVYIYIDFSCFI